MTSHAPVRTWRDRIQGIWSFGCLSQHPLRAGREVRVTARKLRLGLVVLTLSFIHRGRVEARAIVGEKYVDQRAAPDNQS